MLSWTGVSVAHVVHLHYVEMVYTFFHCKYVACLSEIVRGAACLLSSVALYAWCQYEQGSDQSRNEAQLLT